MAGPDRVTTIAPLLLELSPEDLELLHRIVAARTAELADEGLAASPVSLVRAWIRREARRRGLLAPVAGAGAPAPARVEDRYEDPSFRGAPVSATLPAVLAPPTPPATRPHSAEPTMVSEGVDDNPLAAHPSLAPLPEDAEPAPRTCLDFPPSVK